jgi:hypothetical protein
LFQVDRLLPIRKRTNAFFRTQERLFYQRIASEKVRDCHGDLRLEHIFWGETISIFDCIEFNERFRYTDVAADIGFLAMDLEKTPARAEESVRGADQAKTADDNGRLGVMITIPAGNFLMGNSGKGEFVHPEELPQHSVYLPTYQIGKFEVTRGEYRRFIEAGGYQDPRYWSPEGWKWKESDVNVHSGMRGAVTTEKRLNPQEKRNEPEHWAPDQEGPATDSTTRISVPRPLALRRSVRVAARGRVPPPVPRESSSPDHPTAKARPYSHSIVLGGLLETS